MWYFQLDLRLLDDPIPLPQDVARQRELERQQQQQDPFLPVHRLVPQLRNEVPIMPRERYVTLVLSKYLILLRSQVIY
jgi:hypothetical protein